MISLIVAAPAVLPVLPGRTSLPIMPVIWPARPADGSRQETITPELPLPVMPLNRRAGLAAGFSWRDCAFPGVSS